MGLNEKQFRSRGNLPDRSVDSVFRKQSGEKEVAMRNWEPKKRSANAKEGEGKSRCPEAG
jgi:hypothetical protein